MKFYTQLTLFPLHCNLESFCYCSKKNIFSSSTIWCFLCNFHLKYIIQVNGKFDIEEAIKGKLVWKKRLKIYCWMGKKLILKIPCCRYKCVSGIEKIWRACHEKRRRKVLWVWEQIKIFNSFFKRLLYSFVLSSMLFKALIGSIGVSCVFFCFLKVTRQVITSVIPKFPCLHWKLYSLLKNWSTFPGKANIQ